MSAADDYLVVNGFDLFPYLSDSGYKLSRNDGDSPAAGRTMDYLMHRDRIATKFRIDATLRPLTADEADLILPAIMPEYVTVKYRNPFLGGKVITTMYSNNNTATLRHNYDGQELWDVDAIAFVER